MTSLIAYLEHWAAVQPDQPYSIFLNVHGNATESYTYRELDQRTRYLAEYLSREVGLKRGDRALLVYPPGLEIIVAFFACARIGVIPVPVYPPSVERGLAKLEFIINDCKPAVALTTQRFRSADLKCIATDGVRGESSRMFADDPYPILFLQYTSGSTSDPKGVCVSHENVIHNCRAIADHKPIGVSWLPQYHDMGLIGYYLHPIVVGGTTYGFSPTDFLKRPLLWLQTLSRVRATCSSSPNFGFEYCLREDKVPADQLAGIDLSPVRFLMNASEPARVDTFTRFRERFARYGLRPEANVVAYGLAENTLAVTHYGRRIVTGLVSCGKPLAGIHVRIVDPESGAALRDGQTGEVWVAGPSTCEGYWNRFELTREVFENRIANDQRSYLRTGDLGFIDDGELFICGRIKDLIIIRGVNYYPHDIEGVVQSASSRIRLAAAFEAEEGLVVVAEVKKELPDPQQIIHAIYTQFSIRPQTIVFVPPGTIAKTTSGKIARSRTRQLWLAGQLRVIATHNEQPDPPLLLEDRFRHFLRRHNLAGNEDCTLAAVGVDSLGMVTLLDDIESVLKDHGATDLLSQIDARLLQQLTVAELFSLFSGLESFSRERVDALHDILKRLRREHERLQRDQMKRDAQWSTGLIGVDEPVTHVLLTGATGFFGPFLLESLLRETQHIYHVLIRARNPEHGLARIRDGLRASGLYTPAIENRIRVICGDISRYNLGLQESDWRSLATKVQAVIHNAALVNYVLNYDSLRPHNVEGTRELLRFSATGTRKEFHFVSSTIIFGWTVKGELFETDNNDEMLNLDFGYAQTKWVAEQLVFGAARQGLKVRVYRPSFITASKQGVASSDDIVIRLLSFMIKHGIAVKATNQISFLPVETIADNIVSIFKQRETAARTFHVTADRYYNLMDITRLITKNYGYQFLYYDIPEFVAELKRRCTPDDPLYPLLNFFSRAQEKLAAMQDKRYNNDHYRAARKSAEPSLEEVVSYLMQYMVGDIKARVDEHEEGEVDRWTTPRVSGRERASGAIRVQDQSAG
ncbi:MAG TPA: thioester reductase domain-containing protein [Pyrinomonadaceae bacterium]|nr:thioester reductase domain-containing protein [Pyrinomonadaceae bacterium]